MTQVTALTLRATLAPETQAVGRRPPVGDSRAENTTPETTWLLCTPPVSPGRNDWTIWVPDSCAVTGFVERNPYLHWILRASYEKIPAYFTHPCITVGVVDDAAPAGEPCLALVVAVADGEDEAARRLDRFDQEWLRDALIRTRGKMCVVVVPAMEELLPFDVAALAVARGACAGGHTLVLAAPVA